MRHSRYKRFALVFLCLIVSLIVLTGWSVGRAVRQQRLDNDLIAAVKHNDAQVVATLLQQGADANTRDAGGKQSLWNIVSAMMHGRHPLASTGPTALLVALEWRNVFFMSADEPPENTAMIAALLKAGADLNVRGQYGSPLSLAAEQDKRETVGLLLKWGADVNARDEFGTALTRAEARLSDHCPDIATVIHMLKRAGARE